MGFIGLGMLGSAMADRLCDLGEDLVVWNREAEAMAAFAAKGVLAAAGPAGLPPQREQPPPLPGRPLVRRALPVLRKTDGRLIRPLRQQAAQAGSPASRR